LIDILLISADKMQSKIVMVLLQLCYEPWAYNATSYDYIMGLYCCYVCPAYRIRKRTTTEGGIYIL